MPTEGSLEYLTVKNVSRETYNRLTVFHDLLVKWQSSINLIAPSTLSSIWERHIDDSLQTCSVISNVNTVIDIGSGAGFPGIVTAIVMMERGEGTVHLIESNGKKCSFLNAAIRALDFSASGISVEVHCERIEDCMSKLPIPEVVTARALAPLEKLFEWAEYPMSNGAVGVFAKGQGFQDEIDQALLHWKFDVDRFPSRLEPGAAVLRISNLKRM